MRFSKAAVLVIVACAAMLSACDDSTQLPAQTTPAPTVHAPAPVASAAPVAQTPAENYSDFIGQIQGNLLASEMMSQVYLSKIKQAMQFSDLGAYQKAAEDWEDALRKEESELFTSAPKDDVSDADEPYFEDAQNAADDVIEQYLSAAADFGVNAHTGMDSSADLQKDTSDIPSVRRKYQQTVMRGYAHFGVKKSAVNTQYLTLKN